MVDRELLIRAARAVGWRVISYAENGTSVVPGGTAVVVAGGRTFGWRPLRDLEEARHLAEALNIEVRRGADFVSAKRPDGGWNDEPYGADENAAVCRAIVSAAAAMAPEVPR